MEVCKILQCMRLSDQVLNVKPDIFNYSVGDLTSVCIILSNVKR